MNWLSSNCGSMSPRGSDLVRYQCRAVTQRPAGAISNELPHRRVEFEPRTDLVGEELP
jgi:hypothetical protein